MYAAQDNKVAAGGKVAFGHNSDHQLPAAQRIQDALGLRCRTSLYRKPPGFGSAGDQRMIGALLAALAVVLVGPLRHFDRVNDVICQGGNDDGHGGGAAAIPSNIICTIRFIGVPFIQLVEVDGIC